MNFPRTLSTAAGIIAVGVLALSGCASSAPEGQQDAQDGGLTTVRVSALAGVGGNAALYMGIEQGFFEDEGLSLDIQEVQNESASIAALQGGQVDVAYAPTMTTLTAISQGIDLRLLAAADGYAAGANQQPDLSKVDGTSLYGDPESGIDDLQDLKGKKIAIPARKSHFEIVIAQALKNEGIDPGSVEWVTMDFQSASTALKAGQVDAASFVEPFGSEVRSAGMELLLSPTVSFFEEGAVAVWATTPKAEDELGSALAAFQRAIYKAGAYAVAHDSETRAKILEITQMDVAPEDLIVVHWPDTLTVRDVEPIAEKMVKLGFLDASMDAGALIVEQP
ncbi:ABC transporter substrate-binding protein [Microbacterium alcoholitolerans]|uniref:ABC transporter substrate-binding protein n=1 Tax=unclassified Microbacterium TaxID=2609290 RepID=UPI003D17A97B